VGLQGLAGLRPGEALRVEVADFGEGYRTLSVLAPKTKRRRHVRILKPLADDVRAYLLSTGIRSGRLFPAPAGKAEWAEHDWRNWRRRVYQEAAKAEGVTDDMRAYRLRGSFASLLLWETDCQQTDVAKQLGHSLAVLFDRYAGVIEDVKVAKGKRRDAERAVREARAKVAAERARGVA
jgi:integrase